MAFRSSLQRAALATLTISLFLASTASAELLVTGQDRRVSSSVFVNDVDGFDSDQQTEVAPDGGLFDQTLQTEAYIATASGSATAVQSSEMTGDLIYAVGSATGEATASGEAIAYASAQSNVALRFQIDHQTTYILQGFIEGEGNGVATVQFSEPFNTIAFFRGDMERTDFLQEGTLEPGTYDFNITCGGGANAGPTDPATSGAGYYDVALRFGASTAVPNSGLAALALQASPNPFRANTRITVPDGVQAVRIFDAQGRLVRTLEASPTLQFDGRDESGMAVASGVYWMKPVGAVDVEGVKVVRLQ